MLAFPYDENGATLRIMLPLRRVAQMLALVWSTAIPSYKSRSAFWQENAKLEATYCTP